MFCSFNLVHLRKLGDDAIISSDIVVNKLGASLHDGSHLYVPVNCMDLKPSRYGNRLKITMQIQSAKSSRSLYNLNIKAYL